MERSPDHPTRRAPAPQRANFWPADEPRPDPGDPAGDLADTVTEIMEPVVPAVPVSVDPAATPVAAEPASSTALPAGDASSGLGTLAPAGAAPALRPARPDVFGSTDIGRIRTRNEDHFLIGDLDRWMMVRQTSLPMDDHTAWMGGTQGTLLMVADGMGGHGSGDIASSVAVDAFARHLIYVMPWFLHIDRNHETELVQNLRSALERCQTELRRVAAADQRVDSKMGTTLTIAYVMWPTLYVVHAGDSRCYIYRAGRLHQLTTDHTLEQRLRDTQVLRDDEPGAAQFHHILCNVVGGGTDELLAEVRRAALAPGDQVLLCTDGLHGLVPDDEISAVLASAGSSGEACERLIAAANRAGGRDNATVVVARF
jgi:protein phosphatase